MIQVFFPVSPARRNVNFSGQLEVLSEALQLKKDSKFLSENIIGLMIFLQLVLAFL